MLKLKTYEWWGLILGSIALLMIIALLWPAVP
jgi:hypothetical protein